MIDDDIPVAAVLLLQHQGQTFAQVHPEKGTKYFKRDRLMTVNWL
jgi:hypothetical protein